MIDIPFLIAQHIVINRLSGNEDGDYEEMQKDVKIRDKYFD